MHKNKQKAILLNPGKGATSDKKIEKLELTRRNKRPSYFLLSTLGLWLFLVSFHQGPYIIPWFAVNKCKAAQIHTETAGKASGQSVTHKTIAKRSASHDQLQRWLRAGKYAALEKRLNKIQEQYTKGEISDLSLRAAYRSFYPAAPALAPRYAAWIKTYPHSYAAHLAEGIYYIHVGRKARGDKYINQTSQAQIDAMDVANRKAINDLIASLKFDKKPLLSYYWLIDVSSNYGSANPFGAFTGYSRQADNQHSQFAGYSRQVGNQHNQNDLFFQHTPVSQRDLIDTAIRIAPRNFIARWKYMNILETRWGHSTREMIAFLHECRSAHLPPAKLSVLTAEVERDKGWNADNHGDLQLAAKHYATAADLVWGHKNLVDKIGFNLFLNDAGHAYEELHQYESAKKYFARAVHANPNDVISWLNLGYCQHKLKNMPAAAQAYKKGAELGSPLAQNQREKFLNEAGYTYEKQHQYALAKKYFTQAVQADPNDAYSWSNLGYCQRMLRNMPASAQAYKKGAELGSPYAQDEWGKILWYGAAVPQDCTAAIGWYKKAAAKGLADAKKNLYWSKRQFRRHCEKQTFGSRE